jgi:hypothetical protein
MTRYFHRTTAAAAEAILAQGFRDGRGSYMTDRMHEGVWLSDRPLDGNEGAYGVMLLTVDVLAAVVEPYEWIEEGKTYRECLVPTALVNAQGTVATADDEEEA